MKKVLRNEYSISDKKYMAWTNKHEEVRKKVGNGLFSYSARKIIERELDFLTNRNSELIRSIDKNNWE